MTHTLSLTGQRFLSPDSTAATEPPEPQRKWPRALLAGFLSLLFAGTGQLLNRQPRKAFLLALPLYVFEVLFFKTRLPFAFWRFALLAVFAITWRLFVVADAAYAAATGKPPEPPVPMPRFTYSVLAAALTAPVTILNLEADLPFRAFKISAASMCPTLCVGERIFADIHAYQSHPPQRGDLILLQHPSSRALWVKRVIGLPGDTVAPGQDGSILNSGHPFVPPSPCGAFSARPERVNPDEFASFHSTVVPDDTFFVVGDNLANSFDSRTPEFGPVTADMIRGKPLYLYWSPDLHRIGCTLR
jgi:signal peptidase I